MMIARFSTAKALGVVSVTFMAILVLYGLVFFGAEHPLAYFAAKPQWVALLVVALPGSLWLLWRAAMIFSSVVWHKGAAIWTDGPVLIFTSRHVFHAPVNAIADVSAGTYTWGGVRFETIILHLKDGRSKTISTALLCPDCQNIVAGLNAVMGTA